MMGAAIRQLTSGDFLDRARVRRIAAVFLILSLIAIAGLLATSNNGVDFRCRPVSADFFAFWSAARLAAETGGAAAYDHIANREFQLAYPGNCSEFFLPFWSPPQFLAALLPLAALAYLPGWIAFSGLSFAAYAFAMRSLAPLPGAGLPIAAAPGAWFNFLIGQIGLILAALFAAGIACLEKRPWLAGALFGLVAIKPQYGVLIPVFLAAIGNWRAFLAAVASVAAQAAVATATFGKDIWIAFAENSAIAKALLVDSAAIAWEKNISVFALMRSWGAGADIAYAAHFTAAAIVLFAVIGFWRSGADMRLKGAALPAATLMMSPYALDYDLMLLIPAAALFVSHALRNGFRAFEKSLLLLVWFSPVIAYPVALGVKAPVGLFACLAVLAMIVRRKSA